MQDTHHKCYPQGIAKLLVDTVNTGENHFCVFGDVPLLCCGFAVGAVAAKLRVLLPEVFQNVAPQAVTCVAIANHGIQPDELSFYKIAAFLLGKLLIFCGMLNEEFCRSDV